MGTQTEGSAATRIENWAVALLHTASLGGDSQISHLARFLWLGNSQVNFGTGCKSFSCCGTEMLVARHMQTELQRNITGQESLLFLTK